MSSSCCCSFSFEWTRKPVIVGDLYSIFRRVGGSNFATTDVYNHEADAWTNRLSAPLERYRAVGAAVGERIYVYSGGTFLTTHEYDASSNSWDTVTNMPSPARFFAAGTEIGDEVYIFGGRNNPNTPPHTYYVDNDQYTPSSGSWSTKSDLRVTSNGARASHTSCTIDGKGYILGGLTFNTLFIQDADEYDPAGDAWTQKTSAPNLLGNEPASAKSSGRAYTFPGSLGTGVDVFIGEYHPSSDSWATRISSPIIGDAGGSHLGHLAYYLGGHVAGSAVATTREYDPTIDSMSTRAEMLSVRRATTAVTIPA